MFVLASTLVEEPSDATKTKDHSSFLLLGLTWCCDCSQSLNVACFLIEARIAVGVLCFRPTVKWPVAALLLQLSLIKTGSVVTATVCSVIAVS